MFGLRPVTSADTSTELVPDPGDGVHGAFDPYESVAPNSNLHSVTSAPLGFTAQCNLAEVWVIDDAEHVATVGGFGSVLNVSSEPRLVPPAFVAEILKW